MTQLVQQEPVETQGQTGTSAAAKAQRIRVLVIVFLLLLVGGAFSIARRLSEKKALAAETEKLSVPTVSVTKPSAEPASDELVLPAQLQPFVESPIYSRTNGYLLHWYKDIGSHVKKGDLLADIDTPEVDQELSQAKASRQQIQAQLELARSSAERWNNLRKSDSVSQQEADQETSAYRQAEANLAASDANVRRLEQLESFKHIYAPFAGVITQRNTDVGALINAGSSGQKGLFNLAQVDPLRVYVSVPQMYSPDVRSGMTAYLQLDEYPGEKFAGKITRSADAIDPATRTMLTEVDVENHTGRLLPGAFAQVHFAIPVQTVRISVPVNALLFRAEGPRVAVVGPDQKIHLKPVTIGRDFGTKLEILTGLDPSDQIVVNPADSLEDGEQVHVRAEGGNPS
jgi:RND family efflux transporter MFP subunit